MHKNLIQTVCHGFVMHMQQRPTIASLAIQATVEAVRGQRVQATVYVCRSISAWAPTKNTIHTLRLREIHVHDSPHLSRAMRYLKSPLMTRCSLDAYVPTISRKNGSEGITIPPGRLASDESDEHR
jgi:hypothetical protein